MACADRVGAIYALAGQKPLSTSHSKSIGEPHGIDVDEHCILQVPHLHATSSEEAAACWPSWQTTICFVPLMPTLGADAAGYGNMLARPLFREKHKPDMSEDDAMQLMKEALKVCASSPDHSRRLQSP